MKFKMRKKTIIIAGTAVCIAVAGLLVVPRMVSAGSSDVTVSAAPVRMGDLTNYISVTGTVESMNTTYIYAEVNEKVKAVHVKLGDVVIEGQLLCELETEDIETAIAEHKSAMSHSSQQSYNQIKEAERVYNDAQSNLRNSTNGQVNNVSNSLKTAETELADKAESL